MRSITPKPVAKPPSAKRAPVVREATRRDWQKFSDETRGVKVRSLVGVSAEGAPGPAYTLAPEPMSEDPQTDEKGRPRSVWSALLCLDAAAYAALASAAQGCTPKVGAEVIADALLWEATETRRYEPNGSGGWRVWVDPAGKAKVDVWP